MSEEKGCKTCKWEGMSDTHGSCGECIYSQKALVMSFRHYEPKPPKSCDTCEYELIKDTDIKTYCNTKCPHNKPAEQGYRHERQLIMDEINRLHGTIDDSIYELEALALSEGERRGFEDGYRHNWWQWVREGRRKAIEEVRSALKAYRGDNHSFAKYEFYGIIDKVAKREVKEGK